MKRGRRTGTRQSQSPAWFFGITIVLAMASVPRFAAAQRIPELHGTTFSGQPMALPEALRGKVGILVFGFSEGSRDVVTSWGKKLAADYLDSSTVLYYEIPVVASVPKLLRGFVINRIKASVADRGKPHFIALSEDEATWRTLVRYLLLVDSQGMIQWQTHDPPTDATYADLKQRVQTLQARQGVTAAR